MKRTVSDRARQLATELQRLFATDTELAEQLNDAHRRLLDANDRLWSGLHPDGLRALHGAHPAPEAAQRKTIVAGRSQVLDSPDALGALQEVHWQIHLAHCGGQQVGEERRRLAAATGEVIRTFLDELIAAGWSEQEARDANLHELAGAERVGRDGRSYARARPEEDPAAWDARARP
jgi:hypothetical protein